MQVLLSLRYSLQMSENLHGSCNILSLIIAPKDSCRSQKQMDVYFVTHTGPGCKIEAVLDDISTPAGIFSRDMAGPAKAMGIAIAVFMVIIFGIASAVLIPKMSGASAGPAIALNALRTDGNATESGKGLAAMAKGNKEMTEVMRQQVNSEANEIVQNCLDNPDACGDLALLQELCSNDVFQLPSCSDPRIKDLTASRASA